MSLELALKDHSVALTENTDTMKKLIAAWNLLTVNAKAAKAQEAEPLSAGGVPLNLDRAEKVTPPKPAPTPSVPETPAVPAETVAASPSEPLTYPIVSKAITDMVKVNREKAVAVLAQFNAKKGPDLKPAQYADFMAALAA